MVKVKVILFAYNHYDTDIYIYDIYINIYINI